MVQMLTDVQCTQLGYQYNGNGIYIHEMHLVSLIISQVIQLPALSQGWGHPNRTLTQFYGNDTGKIQKNKKWRQCTMVGGAYRQIWLLQDWFLPYNHPQPGLCWVVTSLYVLHILSLSPAILT
jgi:hypothetical protein